MSVANTHTSNLETPTSRATYWFTSVSAERMYIAFKWLFFLGFNMWLAICVFDLFIKEIIKRSLSADGDNNHGQFVFILKNMSVNTEDNLAIRETVDNSYYDKGQSTACLHFIMFLAGALAVTTYHKKHEIITFTVKKIAKIYMKGVAKKIPHFKNTAIKLSFTSSKYFPYVLSKIKMLFFKTINYYVKCLKISDSAKENKVRNVLVNKLKELIEERKSLGQLLISAIHENKNIRMRYQLETMTKNRLIQHIEDTQKQIKENRSRYLSFQQLYMVTHQENTFLKARLGKLKQEKDEAEKNLMSLIHEIYKFKNRELEVYCSRFIVKSKDKLLNLDVSAEIHEFLHTISKSSEVKQNAYGFKQSKPVQLKRLPRCSTRITEILNEGDCFVPLVSDAPRLRGLPGEYVWTVKDKNGMIEKLYEYDYESDLDNGDTIRRIRQYSVYYDKDCLLDFTKMLREDDAKTSRFQGQSITLNNPSSNQRFLTGSLAFKNFLQSNNSVVPIKPPALDL